MNLVPTQSRLISEPQKLQEESARRAFTLVELLVVIAILATLIALLLPAARGAVATARSFKCQMAQRSIAFDFQVWADDNLHPPRGDDDRPLQQGGAGAGRFRLETFQESQYGIDEFWSDPTSSVLRLPDRSGRDPMRCVEVPGVVTLTRFAPCSSGGVGPAPSISFGFNYRLQTSIKGEVMLTGAVLDGYGEVAPGSLPLLMDVDGRLAEQSDKSPVFTAPRMNDSTGLFDQVWFPGKRHKGSVNVAFVDGHVAASKTPDAEPGWAWGFTPPR